MVSVRAKTSFHLATYQKAMIQMRTMMVTCMNLLLHQPLAGAGADVGAGADLLLLRLLLLHVWGREL